MMNKKEVLKWIFIFACMTVSSFFQTLVLKADIGVCACWDAVNMNLSELTDIKIGTFSIIFNMTCLVIQILILRKAFPPVSFLQIFTGVWIGLMVNIFYYDVLTFTVTSYAMKLALLVVGFAGMACSTGFMTSLNLVTFPPEAMCSVIERKGGPSFGFLRTMIDVICIASSIILSLVFHLSFKIREGTVLGMLILGPLMGKMIQIYKRTKFYDWLMRKESTAEYE